MLMSWEALSYRKGFAMVLRFKGVKLIVCLLVPLLLAPLAALPFKEAKCAYVIIWMAIYWMLEPVHLTVTALLPVVLMPLFEILSPAEVCANYMKEVLMMFFGGLAVAAAVEYNNVHERIALKVLLILGSDTKSLLLGFMLTTMCLSMWISNTATTAMMVPIVDAVLSELKIGLSAETKTDDESQRKGTVDPEVLHSTLLLSVAYSANCGGTGTVTGTSPNMVLKGLLEEIYPGSEEITFASWMMYNVPGMLICVLGGWVVLQVIYIPCWTVQDPEVEKKIRKVLVSRYQALGKITFHEMAVLILFIVLVLLWVFRDPKFINGWATSLSKEVHVGDAVPVIGILFLLFLIPADPWHLSRSRALLDWPIVQHKVPWGLILLLGGGFALADGTKKSGLSRWLGHQMISLSSLPPSVMLSILCVTTAILTEVISNSTVATILLPVISEMAEAFEINPLYLMLPITIASSYAFMLPVATGPNAIVFDTGRMKTIDMVKPGILMNVFCCSVQLLMINTLGVVLFDLATFPSWAKKSFPLAVNTTTTF